jgi:hypothetical protein
MDVNGRVFGSVRRLFEALRLRGTEPHPYGPEGDGAVVLWLAGLLPESDPRRRDTGIPQPEQPLAGYSDESAVRADPRFGVNNLRLVMGGCGESEAGVTSDYGTWGQIVADVARIGAGTLRHFHAADLRVNTLFPGEPIPAPATIYADLAADGYARLQCFGDLLCACAVLGLQVVPTLFTNGGSQNYLDALEEDAPNTATSVRAGALGKAGSFTPYVPCVEGWDEFYYEEGYFGTGPTTDGRASAEDKRIYQQYALTVRWQDMRGDEYMEQAACRKGLALAAFAQAIGEYLDLWDQALCEAAGDIAYTICDIVSYLECGNEMEGFFSAEEYGQLMALLAGPIRMECDQTRFRLAEVASWVQDNWADKVTWIRDAILEGLEPEVDRWVAVDATWTSACEAAGFFWPPETGSEQVPRDPTDLVHQVGLHWYHYHQPQDGPDQYQGEARLQEDVEYLQEKIAELNDDHGYSLTWSTSELGFIAWSQDQDDPRLEPYNENASDLFQAGELVRRLLLLRALGAQRICWHTLMSDIAPPWGGVFKTLGLRNDYNNPDYDPQPTVFQAQAAFRRPAWFAYRRLVWLISQADSVSVHKNSGYVTVVELTSKSGFDLPYDSEYGLPAPEGLSPPQRYSRAFVAWVDQEAAQESTYDLVLYDRAEAGYRLLSLVPTVTMVDLADSTDDNGFAKGEEVDWNWEGWDWPQITTEHRIDWVEARHMPLAMDVITVQLRPLSSVQARPAPVCILTHAEWSKFSSSGDIWRNAGIEELIEGSVILAGRLRNMERQGAVVLAEIRTMVENLDQPGIPPGSPGPPFPEPEELLRTLLSDLDRGVAEMEQCLTDLSGQRQMLASSLRQDLVAGREGGVP